MGLMAESADGGGIQSGKGGVRGFGWDPPLLPGSPYGPRRRRAKDFEASILLAPKGPKQKFGCQPQTLEGEEGGPPAVYGRSNTSLATVLLCQGLLCQGCDECAGVRPAPRRQRRGWRHVEGRVAPVATSAPADPPTTDAERQPPSG